MKINRACAGLFGLLLASCPAARAANEGRKATLPPLQAAKLPLPQNSRKRALAPNALPAAAALAMVQGERDLYWLNAKTIVRKSVGELIAQDQDELLRGLHRNKLLRGNPNEKQIALTFDDGPHPVYTPRLLAILKQYQVKATFFVVGEQAERYPDLVRAEVAAGHSVGNHTYDHVSLIKIPANYVATEIKACGEVLEKITGRSPHLFRPPGGEYDDAVLEASEALGYTTVLWTDDPGDYASPGVAVIEQRTLERASSGGILLLHDGTEQTLEALPTIIETLRQRGFRFVTVDRLQGGMR